MNRKTKIVVSVAGILIVTLFLIGLTYAYFLTRINGNTNSKSISASTQKLELTYSDNSSEIIGDGKLLMPSNEPIRTKEFTVTNNGGAANYSVVIEDLSITNTSDNSETTFESNDFRYKLTCTDKNDNPCTNQTAEPTIFPLSNGVLLNNDIAAGEVQTYTLTMWYLETGLDQSADMGKSLSAKINIIDPSKDNPYRNNKASIAYNIINNAINRTNGTELVSTPKTMPAQEITSWEYGKSYEPTTFTSSRENATDYYISYADDYTIDKETGRFTLGTGLSPVKTIKYSSNINPSELAGKYAYWSTNEALAKNYKNKLAIYKITTNKDDITSDTIYYALINTSYGRNRVSTEKELLMAPDDYGTSYYYRGGVKDNYLELNDICFRVVRIQGDGSIKLTLAKEGKCSSITSSDTQSALIDDASVEVFGFDMNSNSHIIYNYENYSTEVGLYAKLNKWYNTKLKSVENKIKNERWCLGGITSKYNAEDGNLLEASTTESDYVYETAKRLFFDKLPSYKCSSELDKVTSYVGTLVADEVANAGIIPFEQNYSYYLYENAENSYYWTLSRAQFANGLDFVITMDNGLNFGSVNAHAMVRPAVTLASGIEISSGDGTQKNPYTVR